MKRATRCALCRRPLPARRWWQWAEFILPPPPFCRDGEVCVKIALRHIVGDR